MESTLSFASSMSPNPPPSNMIPHLTVSPAETTLEASTSAASVSSSSRPTASPTPSTSPEPADSSSPATGEKKPLKKRKSWGQELPVPKTNLPPRKRAKTEDEKEQRRIERVLRNRAAAQTSRERKRLEVEKLESEKKKVETENGVLLQRLAAMEAENQRLSQQIAQLSAEVHGHHSASPQIFSPPASTVATPPCTTDDSTVPATTTTTATDREQSPTLSPTLFKQENCEKSTMNRLPFIPEYDAGAADDSKIAAAAAAGFTAQTSDMTQHPAAMLCDLQCQSEPSTGESAQPATTTSSSSTAPVTAETTLTTPPPQQSPSLPSTILSTIMLVHFRLCQAMVSTTCSSAILQPLAAILRCLKEGSPLPISLPAGTAAEEQAAAWASDSGTSLRQLLPLILWLISTPSLPSTLLPTTSRTPSPPPTTTTTRSRSKTQTQTSSSKPPAPAPTTTTTTTTATAQSPAPTTPTSPTTTSLSQQRSVFRMRLLTRLLACSPALARPLRDATGRALQQVLKREAAAARGSDAAAGIRDVNGLEDVKLCGGSVRCAEELLMGEVVCGWEFLMTVMWVIDCFEKRRKASVGSSTAVAAAVAKKRRVGRRGSSTSSANLSTSRRNRSRKQSSHRQRPKGSGMK